MVASNHKDEVSELLGNWESVFKRGLLTFWILLLLHERPHYPYEMDDAVAASSDGAMSADSNSIYRALRRFESLGLVTSALRHSDSGPDRRYYRLTESGKNLLAHFIQRNLLIFQEKSLASRMQSVLDGADPA